MPFVVLCAVFALALMPTRAVASTPRELLEHARAARDWINNSITETQVEETDKQGGAWVHIRGTVRRFQDSTHRVHLKLRFRELGRSRGQPAPGWVNQELILFDGQHAFYMPGVTVQLARTPAHVKAWSESLQIAPKFGSFLDGDVLTASKQGATVFDLAESGNPKITKDHDSIGDVDCVRIDSTTPAGNLSVWISPSQGFNLAKFVLDRNGRGKSDYSDYLITMDRVKFGRKDGRIVIISAHYAGAYTPSDGTPVDHEDAVAERTEFDFNPTFPPDTFTFADIADGTPTTVDDDPRIRYVWRDGAPVVAMSQETVAEIRKQVAEQMKPAGAARAPFLVSPVGKWLWRIGIVSAAVLGALVLWLGVWRWLVPSLRAKR